LKPSREGPAENRCAPSGVRAAFDLFLPPGSGFARRSGGRRRLVACAAELSCCGHPL